MDNKQSEKTPNVVSKPFMAVGPTLHYSHENVQRCWLLAIGVFCLSCLFWSKILTGSFWAFEFRALTSPALWSLGRSVVTGVSIFEYPWQIFVLGLLMGIISIAPVLISQLMSFGYSVPFILAVVFLANLPGFGIGLFVSCIAVACRPLRFRSRFVAVALCMAPQLVYWGCLGGANVADPVGWVFSFAPWVCAWISGLTIAALVLGIGHFTRYRPGLVWIFTCTTFLMAITVFEVTIGFDELDYQLYVAKNNPEQVEEFRDHSVTEVLDEQITNPSAKLRRHIKSRFYSTEPIPLRGKLKEEIQTQLSYDRWPWWFVIPQELNYHEKKQWLFEQYELFINQRPRSQRMPIALYYKALLNEYSPDIIMLGQKEMLSFYSDYPYERSLDIWRWLYTEFGDSPESIEARWRIAKHLAGDGEFSRAEELLAEGQRMVTARLKLLEEEHEQVQDDAFFTLFRPPADSVITESKLDELERRLAQLRSLISEENRTDKPESVRHLAKFVMLNQHTFNYAVRLDELLQQVGEKDPLGDNVVLAQTRLIPDEQLRTERLSRLHEESPDTDGGKQALYELGFLKISLWRRQDESNAEQKKKYLASARATLTKFIDMYPDSFLAGQVKKNLDVLPSLE